MLVSLNMKRILQEENERAPAKRREMQNCFGMSRFLDVLRTVFAAAGIAIICSTAQAEDRRIVSAGGMITEIAYELGADQIIAGVDTTSLNPPKALKEKPSVGYLRALSAEGILSLNPSLLLTTTQAGPPATLSTLRQAGVKILQLPEPEGEKAIVANILAIGDALGKAPQAKSLAENTKAGFAKLAHERAKIISKKRVLFILSMQNGRVMAAGRNTSADTMIRLAGASNATPDFEGYKTVTNEAVVNAAPDFILMINRGEHQANSDVLFASPSIAMTPAAKGRRLIVMDGLYLLGLGMRTPQAALELMTKLQAGTKPQAGK